MFKVLVILLISISLTTVPSVFFYNIFKNENEKILKKANDVNNIIYIKNKIEEKKNDKIN